MSSKRLQLSSAAIRQIEAKGVVAVRGQIVEVRSRALRAMRSSRQPAGIAEDLVRRLTPTLRDAMLVSMYRGEEHTKQELPKKVRQSLRLGVFDSVIRALEKTSRLKRARKKIEKQAFQILKDAAAAIEQELQETVAELIKAGAPIREGMQTLGEKFDRLGLTPKNGYQLESIFRTQTQLAYNAGQWESYQDPDIDEILWGYTYVTVGDDRVREEHQPFDGVTLPKNDPFWRAYWPPNGWGCFLPGTRVAGCFEVGLKAHYSGPAVEIETASGHRLAVTANHPVLTDNGWLAAGELDEGQNLFSDRFGPQGFSASHMDDEDRPALIEDVFQSLRGQASGVAVTRRLLAQASPLDLYGDGEFIDSKIDVVWSNGALRSGVVPFGLDDLADLLLVESYRPLPLKSRLGAFRSFLSRFLSSQGGSPGRSTLSLDGLPPTLLDTLPLGEFRSGLGPQSNALTFKERFYGSARHAKFFGQSFDGFPFGIPINDRRPMLRELQASGSPGSVDAILLEKSDHRIETYGKNAGQLLGRLPSRVSSQNSASPFLKSFAFGLAAQWSVSCPEERVHSLDAHTAFIRKLLDRSAGRVSRDKIVGIKRFHYTGHVFDLQSATGWILSDGILTKNCRCAVIPVFEEREIRKPMALPNGRAAYPDDGFDFNPGLYLFGDEDSSRKAA